MAVGWTKMRASTAVVERPEHRRIDAEPCRHLRVRPGTDVYQNSLGLHITGASCANTRRMLPGGYVRDVCVTNWQHESGGCPFLND